MGVERPLLTCIVLFSGAFLAVSLAAIFGFLGSEAGEARIAYISSNVTYSVKSNTNPTKVGFYHDGIITARNTGKVRFDYCELILGYVSREITDVYAGRYAADNGSAEVEPGAYARMRIIRQDDSGAVLYDRDRFDKGRITCYYRSGLGSKTAAQSEVFSFEPVLLE